MNMFLERTAEAEIDQSSRNDPFWHRGATANERHQPGRARVFATSLAAVFSAAVDDRDMGWISRGFRGLIRLGRIRLGCVRFASGARSIDGGTHVQIFLWEQQRERVPVLQPVLPSLFYVSTCRDAINAGGPLHQSTGLLVGNE